MFNSKNLILDYKVIEKRNIKGIFVKKLEVLHYGDDSDQAVGNPAPLGKYGTVEIGYEDKHSNNMSQLFSSDDIGGK